MTYKAVVDRVAGLLQGLSYAAANGVRGLDRTDGAVVRSYVQLALTEYWTRYAWPEVCITERRLLRQVYASGSTYAAGAEVWFWGTRSYYQALRAVTAGQAPATLNAGTWTVNLTYWAEASEAVADEVSDATSVEGDWEAAVAYVQGDVVRSYVDGNFYQLHDTLSSTGEEPSANLSVWGLRTDFVRSLSLEQSGETGIYGVRKVWDCDPTVIDAGQEAGHAVRFTVTNDAVIWRGAVDIGWVEFWRELPLFDGDDWSATATYAVGDQIYFTDGDFWECLAVTTAGQSPLTHAAKWERLDFPLVLAEMVAWRTVAEMSGLHGAGGVSAVEAMGMAEEAFGREVFKLERKQGQAAQLSVVTRS